LRRRRRGKGRRRDEKEFAVIAPTTLKEGRKKRGERRDSVIASLIGTGKEMEEGKKEKKKEEEREKVQVYGKKKRVLPQISQSSLSYVMLRKDKKGN